MQIASERETGIEPMHIVPITTINIQETLLYLYFI